ncbi:hypothetical protein HHK36_027238 [Tetracentron sinense]|uniref:MCM C-terminal AAA(+) ATPase domain-containing protein n=1 Tax=Tetracentron sinense TaxID=13715 RepID=A0A835D2V0_TETSI|nr:hypothetical protein HHK36_027238 [Tetracentron sinense]
MCTSRLQLCKIKEIKEGFSREEAEDLPPPVKQKMTDEALKAWNNVSLPPAILSRFDLVYVMIGDLDDQTDYHIAHHIVRVNKKHEDALAPAFTTVLVKCYIVFVKSLKPKVCLLFLEIGEVIQLLGVVRQLETLIRLSEAFPRSHLEL